MSRNNNGTDDYNSQHGKTFSQSIVGDLSRISRELPRMGGTGYLTIKNKKYTDEPSHDKNLDTHVDDYMASSI